MSAEPKVTRMPEPNYTAALQAIKATPVGEAGQYLQVAFFRDDRRHVTLIRDREATHLNIDQGAAELVRLNLA